ncbi:VanZ family protein [Streptomyces buecherae]|uniref:VanZ family protein n=1 Tax=Streptomyces buecherae TaxID=2763006 RepID=UPI001C2679DA|nr:VanZ family protein [Streptomyces buecherae]
MWQVVLYVSPATLALFLTATVGLCLAGARWLARDSDRASRAARALLLLWAGLTLVATVAPTQPLGTGGHAIAWIPGEGMWQPSGHSGAGLFAEERDMIVRLQIANAAMFTPLAALLLFSFPSLGTTSAVLSCLLASATIEATQFLMAAGRTVDIDDLLFNTLGGAIGALIARFSRYAVRIHAPAGRHRA